MKLVTFETINRTTYAGVIRGERVLPLNYPSLLELLQDSQGMTKARHMLESDEQGLSLHEIKLLTPVPDPPTLRDFYAFEQHVATARAQRGLGMIPEWYEIPTFYFSNTSEIYGPDEPVPYPVGCKELDFELEVACVIGRAGKNIPVTEAADYIAGYMIMNDWSARDFQRLDMKLNLGPGKGKDFATSLGPWLVTPDELAERRTGEGASERYDMTMLARVDGKEISRGNFKQIYYSFPQMIAHASRNARLRPGDVLGSGTVGTGCLLELGTQVHPWLQPGETVELEIDGIGVLRNTIV
jgi:fumarylacetoacetate (FAA) hydrolase